MPENTNPETVESFRGKLAAALIAAAKVESLRHTTTNSLAQTLGLGDVVAHDDANTSGYKVPTFTRSATINGVPREDLTEAAQAKHDAAELKAVKREAYRQIRRQVRYDYLSDDAAVAIVKATGLPQPETKTRVEVYVTGWGQKSFVVNGEVTEDQVREKFAPLVSDPSADKIRELFPDAEGLDPGLSVYLRTDRVWPDYPAN